MIVKICGIRTLEDALAAVDAGAGMLGFNFYPPSPRYLDPDACRQLVTDLRRASVRLPALVGVFVNLPAQEVAAILDFCGLDLAQLHGDEPVEAIAALGGRAFKAIRLATLGEAKTQVRAYRPPARAAPQVLLDASAPRLYGGTGLTANWSLAASLAVETRLLLAGGLHPDNVTEAVTTVRPWGVDVASGVESTPGVKDAAKMRLFVQRAGSAAANDANSSEFTGIRAVGGGPRE